GLVRLAPLRLLERDRGLRGHARPQVAAAALEEAVRRLAHDPVLPTIPVPSEADASTAAGARASERSESRPRSRSRRVRLRRAPSRRARSSCRAVRAAVAARSTGPKRAAAAAATHASGFTPNSCWTGSPR